MTCLHLVSRKTAKAAGLSTYYTGVPCKRGGLAERRTINGNCCCNACRALATELTADWISRNREAVKDRDTEYRRARRLQDPERARAAVRRYRQRHAETIKLRGRQKAIDPSVRAKRIEYLRQWRILHPDASRESRRRWRESNRARIQESQRRYDRRNPHIKTEWVAKRRAAERSRVPGWSGEFDRFVIQEARILARARGAATGVDWHVDHMVPLFSRKASGLHCGWNVQVIPGALNVRKNSRLWLYEPDAWLSELSA